ncbi:MAG: VOC family protein [Acidobacteriaceae bacterium]
MLSLTPFLLFDGNCAEAMQFYQNCFGGDLMLTRLSETPMKAQFPPSQHQKITHAFLKSGTVEFSATDWLHPTRQPFQGNTTALYVTGADRDELSPIFDKLRTGANAEFLVDLREMPFGLYGRLTDRYGVEWFFRGAQAAS